MTDISERRAAVEPERSVIVQAPAGSGKTTLLVERYLGLLGVVEEPEEILAITFTRKAAAEMRQRVLQYLDPAFDSDAAHEQAALAKARAVADKVAAWGLRENPQRMLVRTIDSFSHYLARTMPVASQLGPVPSPAENTRALYRQAARNVLDKVDGSDRLADDLKRVLDWRDHRSQDIEDLLVGLLGKREQWLRALGVTGAPDRGQLEAALAGVVTGQLRQARTALDRALAAIHSEGFELAQLLSFAAARLSADGRESDTCLCADMNAVPEPLPEALPQWRGLGEGLLTKAGDIRKSASVATGFPAGTAEKERMVEVLAGLAEDPGLAALLDRARHLPDPRFDDAEWAVLVALVRVLERTAGELELVFAAAGQTDFAGLAAAALRGLGDEESGYTDLGLYLDRRIRHILVDEYQDTNWSQYHLLEKLTAGWQPGEGRSLFLVGDPMQSIYRFREAEVGLFIRTRDEGLGPLALESRRLTRNFRARPEIVDWVNTRLGPVFPGTEDVAAGAVAYSASEAGRARAEPADERLKPGVRVVARPEPVAEAEAVARIVADAIDANAGNPDFKAAIIVRARGHLSDILPALGRHKIPYRAVKLDPLTARPVVQDLLALTRAILNPADTAAVLALLRAPVCGLSLADLHALAGDGRSLHHEDVLDRLQGESRERAARVFETLADAQAHWRRRRLRELVEGAWRRLGGPNCGSSPATDIQDADIYLDALAAADDQGLLADWNDFLELLEDRHTEGDPPSEQIQLELLTMHGAKGLEWDLVVLPGLNRGIGGQDSDLLYWLPFTPPQGGEQVLLAPLRAADQATNPPLVELIRAERKARDAYENQRLLYVAATRAREQLVLSACLDPSREQIKPPSGSLLNDLWPRVESDFIQSLRAFVDQQPAAPEAAGPILPDQHVRRIAAGWRPETGRRMTFKPVLPPREREVEIEFHWAGVQARRTGTVLHRLLEQVGRAGIEALDDSMRRRLAGRVPNLLKAMGAGADGLEQTAGMIRQAFEQTLETDPGRWLLSGHHRDSACELAISGLIDGQLVNAVIDRTFVDENGVRWIIDYKSGYHEGGDLEGFLDREAERYRPQLAGYRRLFEQMGETEIRTTLYFPRHGVLREVE